jgi:hypothetical protein
VRQLVVLLFVISSSALAQEAPAAATPVATDPVTAPLVATPAAVAPPAVAPPVAATTTQERVRVLVLEPSGEDIEADDKRAIVGLIAAGLSQHTVFDVLSNADVQQLMALESQKAAVGCSDSSCLAEIAGALGADLVVFGDAGRLGDLIVLNVSLFDSEKAQSVGRVAVRTFTLSQLPDHLDPALDALVAGVLRDRGVDFTPRPRPPPPSAPPSTAAAEGSSLLAIAVPAGLVGAGVLLGGGLFAVDLFLPTSADDKLEAIDFVGVGGVVAGLALVGTGVALFALDPFGGSDD